MPGPKRTPSSVKSLRGTQRKDRAIGLAGNPIAPFAPLTVVPDPPDWLSGGAAIHEWKRLTKILTPAGRLNEANLEALAILCALHGRIKQQINGGVDVRASLLQQWRMLNQLFGILDDRPPEQQQAPANPFSVHGIQNRPKS